MKKLLQKLKQTDWKDIGKRAIKTFVETFLAYLTFDSIVGVTDSGALKTVIITTCISALAAAITAVLNMFISLISTNIGEVIDGIEDTTYEE